MIPRPAVSKISGCCIFISPHGNRNHDRNRSYRSSQSSEDLFFLCVFAIFCNKTMIRFISYLCLLLLLVSCATEPQQQTKTGLSADEKSEIRETLQRISSGERKYSQDGSIFQNREKRLPLKAPRYYREYTVETPGSRNRGARRLVKGEEGELYYTNDHYTTFRPLDLKELE